MLILKLTVLIEILVVMAQQYKKKLDPMRYAILQKVIQALKENVSVLDEPTIEQYMQMMQMIINKMLDDHTSVDSFIQVIKVIMDEHTTNQKQH